MSYIPLCLIKAIMYLGASFQILHCININNANSKAAFAVL